MPCQIELHDRVRPRKKHSRRGRQQPGGVDHQLLHRPSHPTAGIDHRLDLEESAVHDQIGVAGEPARRGDWAAPHRGTRMSRQQNRKVLAHREYIVNDVSVCGQELGEAELVESAGNRSSTEQRRRPTPPNGDAGDCPLR